VVARRSRQPLKVALIGAGRSARHHAEALEGGTTAQVRYVADLDEARAAAFADEHAVSAVTVDEALHGREVDCVAICTPPLSHADLASAALAAGHVVVLEKPAALTVDALEGIVEASRRAARPAAVMHQHRFALPAAALVAPWSARASASVEVLRYRPLEHYQRDAWRLEQGAGGFFAHLVVHEIDLLCQLFGQDVRVSGARRHDFHPAIDSRAAVLVEFATGPVAAVHATSIAAVRHNRLIAVDEARLLRLEDGNVTWHANRTRVSTAKPPARTLRASVYAEVRAARAAGTLELQRGDVSRARGSVAALEQLAALDAVAG
jgi:predicted dehydrogenase